MWVVVAELYRSLYVIMRVLPFQIASGRISPSLPKINPKYAIKIHQVTVDRVGHANDHVGHTTDHMGRAINHMGQLVVLHGPRLLASYKGKLAEAQIDLQQSRIVIIP